VPGIDGLDRDVAAQGHAYRSANREAQRDPDPEWRTAAFATLDRAGIPHTQFKYSEDTGQFAVIREQAGTFSDSIRLWSQV